MTESKVGIEEFEERTAGFNLFVDLTKAILLRWDRVIIEFGKYKKYTFGGAEGHIQDLASALYELYLTIYIAIEKDKKVNSEYLDEVLFSNDRKEFKEYCRVFNMLSIWLYDKKIITPDSNSVYDPSDMESANQHQGL